jgi:hypothetical protein
MNVSMNSNMQILTLHSRAQRNGIQYKRFYYICTF